MSDEPELPPLTELSAVERRVLGVLVEKALTTPEYYPLTPKALLAGCNQKSNRDPVANYEEEAVLDAIESLRKQGLATEVHTSSGRTPRYRHFLRQRLTVTEPQVAILTELLLRGRQTLGELRSRAGRMVPIESLDSLRDELRGLIDAGFVRATGPLERRGVEVDHGLYTAREGRTLPASDSGETSGTSETSAEYVEREARPSSPAPTTAAPTAEEHDRLTALERSVARLREEYADLRAEFEMLRAESRESPGSDASAG